MSSCLIVVVSDRFFYHGLDDVLGCLLALWHALSLGVTRRDVHPPVRASELSCHLIVLERSRSGRWGWGWEYVVSEGSTEAKPVPKPFLMLQIRLILLVTRFARRCGLIPY